MAAAGSGYLAKGSSYSLTLNLSTVGLNEATIAKYIREQEAHEQDDLLNGSTRLNVSLSTGEFSPNACQLDAPDEMLAGVNAHNSFVTGERKDSYEEETAIKIETTIPIGDPTPHATKRLFERNRMGLESAIEALEAVGCAVAANADGRYTARATTYLP